MIKRLEQYNEICIKACWLKYANWLLTQLWNFSRIIFGIKKQRSFTIYYTFFLKWNLLWMKYLKIQSLWKIQHFSAFFYFLYMHCSFKEALSSVSFKIFHKYRSKSIQNLLYVGLRVLMNCVLLTLIKSIMRVFVGVKFSHTCDNKNINAP